MSDMVYPPCKLVDAASEFGEGNVKCSVCGAVGFPEDFFGGSCPSARPLGTVEDIERALSVAAAYDAGTRGTFDPYPTGPKKRPYKTAVPVWVDDEDGNLMLVEVIRSERIGDVYDDYDVAATVPNGPISILRNGGEDEWTMMLGQAQVFAHALGDALRSCGVRGERL